MNLSPQKLWAFRIVAVAVPIVIGGVVFLILYLTGVLHYDRSVLYLYEPNYQTTGHKYVYDPLLGWKNIPNWRFTTRGKELTINSKGLRDREYSYEKPNGTMRILVLGDSFTWGYGVSNEEIFTEVLERRYEQDGKPVEVINTGVSGWGTDQEFLFLKEEGFKYDPDVVVVAFFINNDLDNNVSSKQYGLDKPVFVDLQLTLGNVPVPKPDEESPEVGWLGDRVELTAAILKGMKKSCQEHNCRLVVMKFGGYLLEGRNDAAQFHTMAERFEKAVREQINVPFLDLDREYKTNRITRTSLVEGNDDGHWNAFGHRKSAGLLHDFLHDQKLVR